MRFHLTAEQVAVQSAVRRALADSWPLRKLQDFADSRQDFDAKSWQAMMQLGLAGILMPGSGMGLLDAVLVSEIAGKAAASGPLIGQMLTVAAVANSNNDALKPHLESLAAGTCVATLAIGGAYVQSASAARFFLANDAEGGLRLVEAGERVAIEAVASTDRSRPVSRTSFDRAISHALFASNHPMVRQIRDAALIMIAADCLGGAEHCTDASVAYAKERVQFGQPIGRFQALKHQLAHMALDVEPARSLVWYAAHAWDAKMPEASRIAALAKAHLCEIYTRTTRAAIAAHGGIGYTWEFGLHYWFRRAVHNRAWLGSPAQHRAYAAELGGW
jgi:alkylation response protein AidB-like acyl-CoA dehydrogenase